ncbi:hypothetical protein AWZ03_002486 [Drosophila navojoa]|uniref:Peptidase C1A papain C-terminal domain-containing protein n=1 Tax=Drosophila navojoa TaxID=7232 RepID=A0A484BQW2_DRONA|nr:cathepsin L1 [Drosophila navojoa]TDG51123.1 hypothetical protein AWZ03_002486 [Drosophila navojoa]
MRMCKVQTLQLLLLFACLNAVSLQTLQLFPKLTKVTNFDDFLRQTGKIYLDANEREFRKSIFLKTKTIVDLSNIYVTSYTLTINVFSDMTTKETSPLLGSKRTAIGEELIATHISFLPGRMQSKSLPESFDWREKGGVTPPGSQGPCGSCWAFATISALEGHLFRRTGVLVPLSQQNLVDCADAYGTEGCDGGFQDYGFEYIRDHGVTLANKYPYEQSENMVCRQNETAGAPPRDSIVKVRDYASIPPGDQDLMMQIIATLGPLACSMNGSPVSFQQYKSGIYDDPECNNDEVNHSVTVVGYGSENGRDYWIVKNSYSQNWGEAGFFRLARNPSNFCGIASECSYPIL